MNTEQERAEFEAWIASPPYEKPIGINPEASGFPGQYRAYEVQLAFEAYQAGRAALQSQDREDAERLDWIEKNARRDPDMGGNHTWWPTSFNKTIRGPSLREAIDHARRVEGEGE